MLWRVSAAVVLLASTIEGQQSNHAAFVTDLATRRDTGSATAVRRHPDAVAEAVTTMLERAHAATREAEGERHLETAEWLSRTHARVWGDSSVLRGVESFRRWSPAQRQLKIAADQLRRSGNAALRTGGVNAALPHWQASLRIASSVPDLSGRAAALGNIGAGFYRAGEPDSARVYLQHARRIAEQAGEVRIAANAVTTLATIQLDRGQLQSARALYLDALALHRRIGDVRGEVADRNNIGLVQQAVGDLGAARKSFEASLRLTREHGFTDESGLSLMNLGNLDALAGRYSAASSRYQAALAAHGVAGNRLDAAGVLHNFGLLELRRGRYSAAAERLHASLVSYDASGSEAQRAEVRNDLAAALIASGDLRGALRELHRMEAIAGRSSGSAAVQADFALTHAELAVQFNALATAAREYVRAEGFYLRANDEAGVIAAREGRAFLSLLRGDYALARQVFIAAAATHAERGDSRAAGIARMLAGAAGHRERRHAWARAVLDQAAFDFRAADDPVGEAAALGQSGDLYRSVGDLRRAEAAYRRGLQLAGEGAPPISWRLHEGLGRTISRARPVEAVAELRRAIVDIERSSALLTLSQRRAAYMDDKWQVYAALAQLQARAGRAGDAFDTSERMRARHTLDLLARSPNPPPSQFASSARGRELSLRRRVALLRSDMLSRPLAHRAFDNGRAAVALDSAELRAAENGHADLLRDIEADDASSAALLRGEAISWRHVAARLPPDAALVEYLVADSATSVFVVRRNAVSVLELHIGRRELASAIEFARASIRRPGPNGAKGSSRPPLRRLYRELFAPLERRGLLAGAQRVILIPHAELHYLPFSALIREGGRERFLAEQYEIEYAPSAAVWVRLDERSRKREYGGRMLALAPRRRLLPGSSAEVNAIRAGYGSRVDVWSDAAASETRFRSAASRYGIIHVATAGVLDRRNPSSSFIELRQGGGYDGQLEVHEVFGLSLKARLVVLSACETALAGGASSDVPAGDDWVGLMQAFIQAGAANVMGTLWRVDDRATARFMTTFYRSLRSGRSESASLAAAQRLAIREAKTADPFYWAPFVMSGAGGHVSSSSYTRR